MTEGKVEFSGGGLSFSGQGEQEWLSKQLDKILAAAPELQKLEALPIPTPGVPAGTPEAEGEFKETLAGYIKAKGGESNQVLRFLATADWLQRRGEQKLTTAAVSKALVSNHQKKLGNPADCLNKNVAKGHCEKYGDGFFITSDGLKELGHK